MAMNRICIGVQSHRLVAGLPQRFTPARTLEANPKGMKTSDTGTFLAQGPPAFIQNRRARFRSESHGIHLSTPSEVLVDESANENATSFAEGIARCRTRDSIATESSRFSLAGFARQAKVHA